MAITRATAAPLRLALLAAALLAGAFSGGCRPPDYVHFQSDFGDMECEVPWGWTVFMERQGTDFYSYTFVGPFDPGFFRGVPSFSVRWYAHNRYRFLPGGGTERYKSADDYVDKMLKWVYGPERFLDQPPAEIRLQEPGGGELRATKFVVSAPADVSGAAPYGVSREAGSGRTAVLRKHGFVVVQRNGGFYVLAYPATQEGFDRYETRFVHLIKSFRVKADGPAGKKG